MKVENVPDDAWRALRLFISERPYGYDYREAVLAILEAWPGMHHVPYDNFGSGYIRLPTKGKDNE